MDLAESLERPESRIGRVAALLLTFGPVAFFFVALFLFQFYAQSWQWKNEHLYTVVEGLGGGIALVFGVTLLLLRPYRHRAAELSLVASAFIGMGIIEIAGFFTTNDLISAWLDCFSIVLGAIFVAALWAPPKTFARFPAGPLTVSMLLSLALSSMALLWGETLLPPLQGTAFPFELCFLIFVSGFSFLLGVWRVSRVIEEPERRMVALIFCYLGLGGVSFPLMRMWGPRWWLVQIVQFVPYLVAVGFLLRLFISGQRRLLQSERRFRQLVNASPGGIGVVDNRSHAFLQANPALCRILGYSEEELASTDLKSLVHPEDTFAMFEDRNKLMRGEITSYRSERRYFDRHKNVVWVRESGALIQSDSGVPQEFRLLEDITPEKSARDRANTLMEELARSKAELEKFASIASHDLQSPLRTISSFASLLERQLQGTLTPEARDSVKFITEACRRLRNLVDDLLAYSRVSRSAHDFQAVNFSEIVGQALENLKFDVEACSGKVGCDPLPVLPGDPVQILQLFQNLISNAIKYRGDRAPVVRITVEESGDEWLFSVRDNGIGFGMGDAERIFAEFQRLHATDYPGTGLGLPICRTIVQRHGGRIWATSTPGQGSTFFFSLPKQPLSLDLGATRIDGEAITARNAE